MAFLPQRPIQLRDSNTQHEEDEQESGQGTGGINSVTENDEDDEDEVKGHGGGASGDGENNGDGHDNNGGCRIRMENEHQKYYSTWRTTRNIRAHADNNLIEDSSQKLRIPGESSEISRCNLNDSDSFEAFKHIETEEDLRNYIRQLSKDIRLSDSEKDQKRQLASLYALRKRRKLDDTTFREDMSKEACKRSYSKVIDTETNERMLGCEHYPRLCRLKAECCGAWVVCRQCHDQLNTSHTMNRFATKQVRCMLCDEEQDVSNKCTNCGVQFARYFCSTCKFYDNTPGKDIYHCKECKICRVGKGIGYDNFHCSTCDACVSSKYSGDHKCLKKSLHADCPICGHYIFTSTRPVVFMQCGHTMHSDCYDDYTAKHYTCPLCRRALTDMKPFYEQIDKMLENEELPPEIRHKQAQVLCYDCNQRSETQFRYNYLKCDLCKGYNTTLIRAFDRELRQENESQFRLLANTDCPMNTDGVKSLRPNSLDVVSGSCGEKSDSNTRVNVDATCEGGSSGINTNASRRKS